jgi:hypothetical protein
VRSLGTSQRARARNEASFVRELGDRRLQLRTLRQDNRALDEVLQLADIAWPTISDERRQDLVRDVCD